jgi:hypothetical protein
MKEYEELIKALRYCAEHEGCDYYIAKDCPREDTWVCGADCEQILMLDAADALEAAEKRIDGLLKLVDINTERCEALRKQLRESHENYERHIAILEAKIPKQPTVDAVQVVRCGECKHAKDENFISAIWCENLEKYLAYDFFCHDGERKDTDKGEQ